MPVAIITGASKGLGRALAGALAVRGWDLVVDARSAGPLEEAARALAGAGELGELDLLVNNASALGAEPLVRLADLPLEGLRRALEVNVVAPLGMIQTALPLLRCSSYWESYESDSLYRDPAPYIGEAEGRDMSDSPYYGGSDVAPGRQPGGAVLNISSDAAVEAYPTWGGYGSAKAALDRQSAVLAVEEPGLRVWWVDPGDMRTDLYAAAVPDDDADRPLPETVVPALLRLLDGAAPSGRYTAAELLRAAGTGASGGAGSR
ncbi:SDR family NAD(P)-dependent oxidoreductase [Streptomyces sp. NPDC001739]